MTHDAPPSTEPPSRRRRLWARLGIAAGAVVFVVTAATTIIPLIADMAEDGTTPDSLQTGEAVLRGQGTDDELQTSAPIALDDAPVIGEVNLGSEIAEVDSWLVPTDAAFETFPSGWDPVAQGCTSDQLRWLEANAHRGLYDGGSVSVFLRNAAMDGAAMSLDNVRLEGEWTPTAPAVWLQCRGGRGGDPVQMGRLDVSGGPAVWDADPFAEYGGSDYSEGFAAGVEGAPVTANLSPGELLILSLLLPASDRSFSGAIVADMLTPSEQVVVLADGIRVYGPTVTTHRLDLGTSGGVLTCERTLGSGEVSSEPCDLPTAAAFLREAGTAR